MLQRAKLHTSLIIYFTNIFQLWGTMEVDYTIHGSITPNLL